MVSREELYELVWSMPMTKAAEKFSVSELMDNMVKLPEMTQRSEGCCAVSIA